MVSPQPLGGERVLLFDDLLKTADFRATVNGLARAFRDRHTLPPIHQLGLVVPDVERAASALEEQGIAPFFIAGGAPVLWRERGGERRVRGRMGLAYYRGIELELLEPLAGSDFYNQALDSQGGIVLHHIGVLVRDVDAWAEGLAAAGVPVWVRGCLKMGPVNVDFAYMDTVGVLGYVFEFICWRMGGWRFRPPPRLLRGAGWLEKWSGRRSISV